MIRMGSVQFQHKKLGVTFRKIFRKSLRDSSFIGGKEVDNFEAQFSLYTGASHCVAVGNGTDALEIILRALDLVDGARVAVPANSFAATAGAVINCGLEPIFVDVNDNFQMDLESLKQSIGSHEISAVILAPLYGLVYDDRSIRQILDLHEIPLVFDAAQAAGSRTSASHYAVDAVASAFSFYPGKNLGALGDGGAIVTNSESLSTKARRLANHGRLSKFDHELAGRNSRLDAIQAAFLSEKVPLLDSWIRRRRRNAKVYFDELESEKWLKLPPSKEGSAYHQFVIQTKFRDELREYLGEHGIETGLHYPYSLDELDSFKGFGFGSCPNSRMLARTVLSLPVGEHLSERKIRAVVKTIKSFGVSFAEQD